MYASEIAMQTAAKYFLAEFTYTHYIHTHAHTHTHTYTVRHTRTSPTFITHIATPHRWVRPLVAALQGVQTEI